MWHMDTVECHSQGKTIYAGPLITLCGGPKALRKYHSYKMRLRSVLLTDDMLLILLDEVSSHHSRVHQAYNMALNHK